MVSGIKDPLFRYLTLLKLIPPYPGKVSTPVLHEKLAERGFHISQRSLQRDLEIRLPRYFPVLCDTSEKPYRWSLDPSFSLELRALDVPWALALTLAEEHLQRVLPQTVLDRLSHSFIAARHYLDSLEQNRLAHWSRRVRTLPNGKALTPPSILSGIWEAVSNGLIESRELHIDYLNRKRGKTQTYVVHPLGLVSRHTTSYLVARKQGSDEIRSFALHRIQHIQLGDLSTNTTDTFDMDSYIASGVFALRESSHEETLIADVHPQIAWLLNESPLSAHQSLEPLTGSSWYRLEARIHLDQETFWWLFGLNDQIRLYSPAVWRNAFAAKVQTLHEWYVADATPSVASTTDNP